MDTCVKPAGEDTLVTRPTLSSKIRKGDEAAWTEFFDLYKNYVRAVALKSLPANDAEDVVLETMICVNKHIESFVVDKQRGKFRTWLYVIVTSRIRDRLRRRNRDPISNAYITDSNSRDEETRTSPLAALADPNSQNMDQIWEREWAETLLSRAVSAVRREVKPEHFQAYELCDLKGERPKDVARMLNVGEARVRLWTFRVRSAVAKEARLITKRVNL